MRKPLPYPAMLAESKRIGLPVRFERDLTVHDKAFCDHLPDALGGIPLAWMVGPNGTHLVRADNATVNAGTFGRGSAAYVRCVVDAFPDVCFYFWDGMAVKRCPSVDALVEECEAELQIVREACHV